MITNFLLVFGIVMIINGIFSYKQVKVTSGIYGEVRKKGNLIVGEKRFCVFLISNVVAFAIGNDGRIKDAVKVSGMLPFQKVKTTALSVYIGKKFTPFMDPEREKVDAVAAKIVSNMIRRYAR